VKKNHSPLMNAALKCAKNYTNWFMRFQDVKAVKYSGVVSFSHHHVVRTSFTVIICLRMK